MPRKFAYRNLPHLFLKGREKMLCHFRPILTHFGLTEQQWRIMRAVSEVDQLEQHEICDVCQILSPSLAGVLARMENLGLVIRTRIPEDRRRVIIRLTPEAEKLVVEITPLINRQYKIIEQALGTELLQEVYDLMDKLVAAADNTVIRPVKLPERMRDR